MSKVYGASAVKRRPRSTKQEMVEFRRAIFDIAAKHQPCSGRQIYYRAVVAGLIDKDTGKSRKNEQRVGDALNTMREAYVDHTMKCGRLDPRQSGYVETCRRNGIMPFEWITDDTRTRFKVEAYRNRDAALRDLHRSYRRDLWQTQPRHVEVWCESSSLAGVLLDTTDEYGVALLPCRGQAGKGYLWGAAQQYGRLGRPVTCLYVGDFDPAGLDIGNSVRDRLVRYLCGKTVDFEFRRIAVTAAQVAELGLPGHGLNRNVSDSQIERFRDACDTYGVAHEAVEAEAMPPTTMRELLSIAIAEYIDDRQWQLELDVERAERRGLFGMIGKAS